ncbi:hypothetical protein B0T18DRAFT_428015 [Schizothecium vesticola]|uniref:Uncharacterized protein n=1 Tax=Schizothecium vesticola TaxID=314040 RepID=A0AA40F2F3_9PEZI|nr:hypothetical protein B0T18DRAFT_428015 [Schizothecium vesticola]
MPPRLNAPKLPDLSRTMAATQPEQAEKKSFKKKKNKKRRPVSADEAAQPQTGADEDDEAEKQAPPAMREKDAIPDVSPERKRKNKKKRQSQVQSEVQSEMETLVETVPQPKKKKKHRHSEVQEEEPVVELAPEPMQKKKRHSELPPVEDAPIPKEPMGHEDEPAADNADRKRKKKRRHSEIPPVEELPIHEEAVVDSTPDQRPKKKQKKKKRHSEAQLGDETLIHDMLVFQAVFQAAQDGEAPVEASPERKRKKKKPHSGAEGVQLVEETTAPEPAIIEVSPEQKTKKKKKSRRHSAAAEAQLPEEPVAEASKEEEAILEAPSEPKGKKKRHSEVLYVDQSNIEPSSKSERKKRKKKKKKKQLADEDSAALEDSPESPPALKSTKKKRGRTEDPDQEPATSTKKSRKQAPPSEADELELQDANRPSLLASHLNGDTSAVASLWEQRLDRQQTVPATQPTSTVDGGYLWPPAERDSPVLHGDSSPSRQREESIDMASEAEDRGLPTGRPQIGEDRMHVDSVPRMSPFANDDIESVASDEEGRPLGNRAPSIESDSDRVPDSLSPESANAGSSDGSQDAADIEMHDVESDLDNTRQPDEEEVSATPYPEPHISSTATSTHSRPTFRQETETPPQELEDGHQRVSSPTTEDSQPELDNDNGQLGGEVAQPPSLEPVLTERAKGKRPVRKFNQEPEMLQDPDDEAQKASSAPRHAARSERTTDVLDVDGGKDDTPAATSTPAPKSLKTPKSRMSMARKPKTPFFEEVEVEKEKETEAANAQAFAELPGSEVAGPSRSRPNKKPPMKDDAKPRPKLGALANGQLIKGPMTADEEVALKRAVENFRQEEGLTPDQLKDLVHGTPKDWKKGDRFSHLWTRLWPYLMDACPGRTRKFLITKTRLRFHRFVARGTWTKEQEDELLELIKKYPTAKGGEWTKIGGIINRWPEDCREYWRNKGNCRDTRRTDYWTEDEEQMLYEAVQQAVIKIKGTRDFSEISDKGVSELVDWIQINLVGMKGGRDRLQCYKKWIQFRQRGLVHDDITSVMLAGESWRLLQKDLKTITADDKYKMVKAIADSNVLLDARVPWKKIEVDILENRFERKAITMAWSCLRNGVPGEKDMGTRVCAKYILEKYEKEGVFAEVGMSEDDILDPTELPSESASPAEGESAPPGAEIPGIPMTRQKFYRTPRVKKEAGESNNLASIPQKPKPATKPSPKAAKPSAPTKASTRTSTARKSARSAEFARDSDTDEVPESDQEDVSAAPREPSIDLGLDASRTPVPRTYGGRIKTVARRTVVVDSDEEDAPSGESSPAKRTRSAKRKAAVLVDEDDEDVKPPREESPAPPVKRKKTYKRKRNVVEEEDDEEPEVRPSPSATREVTPSQKKRKTRAVTVGDWEAPVGVPLRALSMMSSDMDDMEDIQATLPS